MNPNNPPQSNDRGTRSWDVGGLSGECSVNAYVSLAIVYHLHIKCMWLPTKSMWLSTQRTAKSTKTSPNDTETYRIITFICEGSQKHKQSSCFSVRWVVIFSRLIGVCLLTTQKCSSKTNQNKPRCVKNTHFLAVDIQLPKSSPTIVDSCLRGAHSIGLY